MKMIECGRMLSEHRVCLRGVVVFVVVLRGCSLKTFFLRYVCVLANRFVCVLAFDFFVQRLIFWKLFASSFV